MNSTSDSVARRYLIPFLATCRVDLIGRRRADLTELRDVLRSTLSEGTPVDALVAGVPAVRHHTDHSPVDARMIVSHHATRLLDDHLLCSASLGHSGVAGIEAAGVGVVVGQMGLCALVVDVIVVPDDEEAFEASLLEASGPVVTRIAHEVGQAFTTSGLGRHRGEDMAPAGQPLWIHRVLVGADGWADASQRFDAREAAPTDFRVGTGWSWVAEECLLPDATEGLLVASEDWVVLDATSKLLAALVCSLDDAEQAADRHLRARLERVSVEAFDLERQAQLIQLYLDERSRFLEMDVRRVWQLARTSWGITDEVRGLHERASATRDLASGLRDWRASLAAASRERLLVVLAVITGLQCVLIVFDFTVAETPSVHSGVREGVGVLVGLVTLGLAAFAVASIVGRRDAGNGADSESHR